MRRTSGGMDQEKVRCRPPPKAMRGSCRTSSELIGSRRQLIWVVASGSSLASSIGAACVTGVSI